MQSRFKPLFCYKLCANSLLTLTSCPPETPRTIGGFFCVPQRTETIPDMGCRAPKGDVLLPPGAVQPRSGVHQDPEGDYLKCGEGVKFQEGWSSLWYRSLKTQIGAKVLREKIFSLHTVALAFFSGWWDTLSFGPAQVPPTRKGRGSTPRYPLLCPFNPWHVSMSLHFTGKIKFLIWRH